MDYNAFTWVEKQTKVGPTRMNAIELALADASKHHKIGTYAAMPSALLAKNWLYFATDRWGGSLFLSDGTNWRLLVPGPGIEIACNGTGPWDLNGLDGQNEKGYHIQAVGRISLNGQSADRSLRVQPNQDAANTYGGVLHRDYWDGASYLQDVNDVKAEGTTITYYGMLLASTNWGLEGDLDVHATMDFQAEGVTGNQGRVYKSEYASTSRTATGKMMRGVAHGRWRNTQLGSQGESSALAPVFALRFAMGAAAGGLGAFYGVIRVRPFVQYEPVAVVIP